MKIHTFIGSVEEHTHFNPTEGEPEVDPLFPLFHTFIDYVRLLRADCWDFDTVAAEDLYETIPFGYSPNTNETLDYVMTFSVLCDGTAALEAHLDALRLRQMSWCLDCEWQPF